MSNTPFLFIGISFIVSTRISFGEAFYPRLHFYLLGYLLLYLQEYLLEKHFIRGSTNVSFWELPAVRRTSVSVLCDNWYGW